MRMWYINKREKIFSCTRHMESIDKRFNLTSWVIRDDCRSYYTSADHTEWERWEYYLQIREQLLTICWWTCIVDWGSFTVLLWRFCICIILYSIIQIKHIHGAFNAKHGLSHQVSRISILNTHSHKSPLSIYVECTVWVCMSCSKHPLVHLQWLNTELIWYRNQTKTNPWSNKKLSQPARLWK